VRTTLEKLRHAGIKVWMLTGDKIETATCVARSSKLVARNQSVYQMVVSTPEEARHHLHEFAQIQNNTVLVIDGTSLQLCLDNHKEMFFNSTRNAPSVVCCRCSPTQKVPPPPRSLPLARSLLVVDRWHLAGRDCALDSVLYQEANGGHW